MPDVGKNAFVRSAISVCDSRPAVRRMMGCLVKLGISFGLKVAIRPKIVKVEFFNIGITPADSVQDEQEMGLYFSFHTAQRQ